MADDALGHGARRARADAAGAVSPTTSRPATAPRRPSPWVSPRCCCRSRPLLHTQLPRCSSAAFGVLLAERRRSSPWMTAAARLLAGLGIVVEYPQALVALAPWPTWTAASRRPAAARVLRRCRGRRAAAARLRRRRVRQPVRAVVCGVADRRARARVLWRRLARPAVAELLGGGKGMLTLTPVVAAGVAGLVALFRRGHRAEAAPAVRSSSHSSPTTPDSSSPFAAGCPGPRLRPRVAVRRAGLAAAYAERAAVVLALAAPSLAFMVAATVTSPMIPDGGPRPWLDALRNSELSETVVSLVAGDRG